MVSPIVLLDAGPLGLVTNPRRSRQSIACAQWLQTLVGHGSRVLVVAASPKGQLALNAERFKARTQAQGPLPRAPVEAEKRAVIPRPTVLCTPDPGLVSGL